MRRQRLQRDDRQVGQRMVLPDECVGPGRVQRPVAIIGAMSRSYRIAASHRPASSSASICGEVPSMESSCRGRPPGRHATLLLALDRHEVPEQILTDDGKELTGR